MHHTQRMSIHALIFVLSFDGRHHGRFSGSLLLFPLLIVTATWAKTRSVPWSPAVLETSVLCWCWRSTRTDSLRFPIKSSPSLSSKSCTYSRLMNRMLLQRSIRLYLTGLLHAKRSDIIRWGQHFHCLVSLRLLGLLFPFTRCNVSLEICVNFFQGVEAQ